MVDKNKKTKEGGKKGNMWSLEGDRLSSVVTVLAINAGQSFTLQESYWPVLLNLVFAINLLSCNYCCRLWLGICSKHLLL